MTFRPGAASALAFVAAVALTVTVSAAEAPIEYVLTFPEPHQRWMQVEMTVRVADTAPLQFRMSRSSPGRYAVHDFAKNVWDVAATDGHGRPLETSRPNPHQWNVVGHGGIVTLRYKVYGDRVDGTYLAVDSTHAHMNVPATLMFVRGLAGRPARVRLVPPPGRSWRPATQLFPTGDPLVFTAPNAAYLFDSPIEFGEINVRSFTVPSLTGGGAATIRVAVHHTGTDADLDAYVRDVERVVREQQALMGELPPFEPGSYTFLADYVPWADGDGMEHRNSTVITSSSSIAASRVHLVATVAHEFFHAWNVERIRPRSLEPFDLEDVNLSGELWLAEGFTSYVDSLTMVRAGLMSLEATLSRWGGLINAMRQSPAVRLRSAVENSQLAPFVDAARAVDRTNWESLHLSYYTHGAAVALALDLALRDRSDGRVSLDDYLRALWARFGRPGVSGPPGAVATPYTLADLRDVLGAVAGDLAFAEDFFARHVQGREIFDYAAPLARAGFVMRPAHPEAATLGTVAFDFSRGRAKVSAPTPLGSPAYLAGLAQDDVLESIDGITVVSGDGLRRAIDGKRPGRAVTLVFTRRSGESVTAPATLAPDVEVDLRTVEQSGGALTDEQRAWRRAWIASRQR